MKLWATPKTSGDFCFQRKRHILEIFSFLFEHVSSKLLSRFILFFYFYASWKTAWVTVWAMKEQLLSNTIFLKHSNRQSLCLIQVYWRSFRFIMTHFWGKGHMHALYWWNHISHSKKSGWTNSASAACSKKQLKDPGRQRQGVYISEISAIFLAGWIALARYDPVLPFWQFC